MKETIVVGNYKLTAELDGPLLRVSVLDEKGEPVEWLCSEVNDGRGIVYTSDEDMLALDGVHGRSARWSAFERAETDAEFKRVARLSDHDMQNWRKCKAEEEAEQAKMAVLP